VQGGVEFLWQVVAKNARDLFRVMSYLHAPVDLLWPRIVAFAAPQRIGAGVPDKDVGSRVAGAGNRR
jgi:hypothetical protein